MTHDEPSDDALTERFAASRARDAMHAPPFERVIRGRTVQRISRTWTRVAIVSGAMALVLVALARRHPEPQAERTPLIAFTAGSLRVPTDFLLDQAASLRADAMPSIGAVDWSPLPNTTASPRRN